MIQELTVLEKLQGQEKVKGELHFHHHLPYVNHADAQVHDWPLQVKQAKKKVAIQPVYSSR